MEVGEMLVIAGEAGELIESRTTNSVESEIIANLVYRSMTNVNDRKIAEELKKEV